MTDITMVTIYNVISKDGFIARSDGGEDFIPEEIWEYDMQFFRQFDTWVMGRKTYESAHFSCEVLCSERPPAERSEGRVYSVAARKESY